MITPDKKNKMKESSKHYQLGSRLEGVMRHNAIGGSIDGSHADRYHYAKRKAINHYRNALACAKQERPLQPLWIKAIKRKIRSLGY